jgi:type IV pilus assembly protein PilE
MKRAGFLTFPYQANTPMQQRGFTLIEIMIVVAILGLLAAIAIPSYQESVRKSRRAEARGQLLEVAQYMQRFYSQNDSFATRKDGTAFAIPSDLALVPRTAASGAQSYTIGFTAATASASNPGLASFKIQAVRRPGGPMASDKCGDLTLENTGLRGVLNASDSVENCWK